MKFEIWFPLVVAVGPTLLGLLALRGQYKKESAEASSINVDTAIKLMKKLEMKVERLVLRIETVENQNNEYERLLRKLIKQCERLGIEPEVTIVEINNVAKREN